MVEITIVGLIDLRTSANLTAHPLKEGKPGTHHQQVAGQPSVSAQQRGVGHMAVEGA